MGEIGDQVSEAVEMARESRLHGLVAVLVAVTATFLSICNVKGGNVVQKGEIKAKAEGLEKEYDRLSVKDDQFDIAEACLTVGIALFGITALTQKRWLLGLALGFAGFGALVGLAGFVGWDVRPEWIAKLLG